MRGTTPLPRREGPWASHHLQDDRETMQDTTRAGQAGQAREREDKKQLLEARVRPVRWLQTDAQDWWSGELVWFCWLDGRT